MFDDLKKIYDGKRVFLTGHTGFKGSWLLRILNILGAEVMGYALSAESGHDLYHTINGDALCTSVIADLRDRHALNNAIADFKPDFIFHLAAQPLVRLSYQIPSETFEVNAIGTANLLDALRLLDKACYVVLVTTDKVYNNEEWDYPYRETDRLGGYDPYSASKACAELVIDSYRNSFFNTAAFQQHKKAIAVGRAGNVIGGGDWAKDRLIPDIIKSLSENELIELRNPNAIRPWQHVLEPLYGYLLLGAKLSVQPELFSQAYNFGPDVNDVLSVTEMTILATKAWGSGDFFVNRKADQPHEAGLLKLDISKTRAQLNWMPRFNAVKAVEATVAWYKSFYEHNNMADYTKEQILNYFNA